MSPCPPPRPRRRARPLVALLAMLVAAAAVVALAGCGGSSSKGSNTAGSGVRAASTALKPAGMGTIAEASLPAEARDVIRLIESGGTFQYRQDGATFQNREGLLPSEPRNYYREYTVATPGAADRGARRLILGRQGELYYTPDHYRSFVWVMRGGAT